jgi:hypothetical protein
MTRHPDNRRLACPEERLSVAITTEKTRPHSDVAMEAQRLCAAAGSQDLLVRLVGGVAIQLHQDRSHPVLTRVCKDIDLVTRKGAASNVTAMMSAMGYEPDQPFNAVNGHRRLLYYDRTHERQVDVFVGSFEMCHRIPIADRLHLEGLTVPLAELLLTKYQVVDLNEKDLRDIVALFYSHEVAENSDENAINAAYVARLCAADWGLWRTFKLNTERVQNGLDQYAIPAEDKATVRDRINALWSTVEAEPKPTKWKMRNRIGDRVRWYEEPEEVG